MFLKINNCIHNVAFYIGPKKNIPEMNYLSISICYRGCTTKNVLIQS